MNKSAAKEPSMDEILSSIRQIIADDDAGPQPAAAETAGSSAEEDISFDLPEDMDVPEMADMAGEEAEEESDFDSEALALSAAQILEDDVETEESVEGFDIPDLSAIADVEEDDSEEFSVPELVVPDDISFDGAESVQAEPMPADATVAEAAPMPDPSLSSEMADQLLEPATDAAVKNAFSKLGNVALGAHNLTIENMIREMLRPMLKEWLDENLPTVVEKMVEKEIQRLSSGG